MYENVNIRVTATTPTGRPIPGVVVKILSLNGRLVYGQPITDEDGYVRQLLPDGYYEVRFFKFGVTFGSVRIQVLASSENNFLVRGELYKYPQSTDPRLCTASGFFRTPTGGVASGVDIHFIAKWKPITLENAAIMPERVTVRSNKDGYAELSLIRFGQYNAMIEGMEDYQRVVNVPDAPAVNITDLLFPVIDVITFEENSPYQVPVGEDLVLTPHVFSSDLNELEDITSDVLWYTDDSNVFAVNPQAKTLSVRGIVPGTYELRADRRDQSIVRIPNTPIQGVPVQIVVTP